MHRLLNLYVVFIIAVSWNAAVCRGTLVGEWLFDGNVNDTSGNGQHGTVFGAILAPDRFGAPNQAYDFSTSYIELPTTFLPAGAGPISYSLWVNPRNNPGLDHRLIHHGSFNPGRAFNLYIDNNAYRLDYWGSQYYDFNDTTQGQWQHIALVSDGSEHAFYLNGTETSTDTKTLNISAINAMTLGRHPGDGFFFDGTMDDLRVFDHVLTLSEIRQLADLPDLEGDFNIDGRVDGLDFLTWQIDPGVGDLADWEANYGVPMSASSAAVPEPRTLFLALATLFFSVIRIRRS